MRNNELIRQLIIALEEQARRITANERKGELSDVLLVHS